MMVGVSEALDEPTSGLKAPDPLNINMTVVAHHAGECAVGATCGVAAAWVLRKVQSTAITLAMMGGVGAIAALHLKWVSFEQLQLITLAVMNVLQGKAAQVSRAADLDKDGDVTLQDGRIAYSRVAPLIRDRPALTGGILGGFVSTFAALR